jgi:hypothetical protein
MVLIRNPKTLNFSFSESYKFKKFHLIDFLTLTPPPLLFYLQKVNFYHHIEKKLTIVDDLKEIIKNVSAFYRLFIGFSYRWTKPILFSWFIDVR